MAEFPDDEEAVSSIEDEMLAMCGNAGQESIILNALSDFEDKALSMLEEDGEALDWDSFKEFIVTLIGPEKFDATDQIWEEGYNMLGDQSDYHDSNDEQGEGTGEQFGGSTGNGDDD